MQSSHSCPAPELHLHMTISRVFIREWKGRHMILQLVLTIKQILVSIFLILWH